MSFRADNFYRYHGTIAQLQADLRDLRARHITRTCEEIYAYYQLFDVTRKDLRQQIYEITCRGERDELNIRAEACVYWYRRRWYVQFFGVTETLGDRFIDFSYQNQSDPEPGYYRERRHTIVPAIFAEFPTPQEAGFVFHILGAMDVHKIMSYIVTTEHQGEQTKGEAL